MSDILIHSIDGPDFLMHHGILGQKWGVRRYQNEDGSYTKAGLKRYHESHDKYEIAKNIRKGTKELYKHGSNVGIKVTKNVLKDAKNEEKKAKKQMIKDYKHLKQDKLADQGKRLYSNGKTITGSSAVTSALASIGGMSIGLASYNRMNNGNNKLSNALIAVGLGTTIAAGAKKLKDANQARKLRAYYSHTSKY